MKSSHVIPEEGSRWKHANGIIYRILLVANLYSQKPEFPITLVYENMSTGSVWARPYTSRWHERYTELTDEEIDGHF